MALAAMVTRLEKAQAAHAAAALELEMSARECALVVLDAHPVSAFVMSARQQLEPAVPTIIEAFKQHARAVAAGTARPSLPQPAPEVPKPKLVPALPTQTIFITRNVKYVGAQGAIICCGQYRRHELPLDLAELALRSHMALPLSDPRVKKGQLQEGAFGMFEPTPQTCEWLGEPAPEPAPKGIFVVTPIKHEAFGEFTPMNRGLVITGTMPAQPLVVGARMLLPPDEE